MPYGEDGLIWGFKGKVVCSGEQPYFHPAIKRCVITNMEEDAYWSW